MRAYCARMDPLPSFGPYRVRQRLGAGGMASVWLAEQEWPVRRWIALKVIRAGAGETEVAWRFAGERRALAAVSHPNIAEIYDAGVTPEGRLYIAMEFVEGEPITTAADRARLGVDERLELFLPVCDAVQHAHQRGVIHRDLKPSNIIVTREGGHLVPKVIDFGVAKAVSLSPRDLASSGSGDRILGTPAYMSPEQTGDAGESVDGRADVYALGALLYELLSGALPLDGSALSDASDAELRRLIRRSLPPPPSCRVGDEVAAARRTTPQALGERLRGDLDVVVLRALEKAPDRRYAAPRALADDLRRYLRDEPVLARSTPQGRRGLAWLRRVWGR